MDKQWSVYFDRYGNPESPFGRVNPHIALSVVEKYVEWDEISVRKLGIITCFS